MPKKGYRWPLAVREKRMISLPTDEIVRRYQDGESSSSLGRSYGVSDWAIRHRLVLAEVPMRSLSEAGLVRFQDPAQRQRHSDSCRGRVHTIETRQKIAAGHQGEKAYNWKGDDVGYSALHQWLRKNYGRASTYPCFNGFDHPAEDWANVDGQYSRDIGDFVPLCTYHHIHHDRGDK